MSEVELIRVTAGDGLELAMERHRPASPSRGAVMLQHGLASNRAVFVTPGRALATRLAELGYDTFATELRGAGRSARPRTRWSIDEYLEHDIPALLEAIRSHSGHARVAGIGHSMGGILLWMYALEHPEGPLERLVTVGSALDYRPGRSVHHDSRRFLPLAHAIRTVPFRQLARITAPLSGRGPVTPIEGMNFKRSNVDRERMQWLLRNGFEGIPAPLLKALSESFSERGMARVPSSGSPIAYLERAGELRVPTLLLGGRADAQCPAEAVEATATRLGEAAVETRIFGKPYGHDQNYGHFDLLVGERAPDEVWPHIERFLGAELQRVQARSA